MQLKCVIRLNKEEMTYLKKKSKSINAKVFKLIHHHVFTPGWRNEGDLLVIISLIDTETP